MKAKTDIMARLYREIIERILYWHKAAIQQIEWSPVTYRLQSLKSMPSKMRHIVNYLLA